MPSTPPTHATREELFTVAADLAAELEATEKERNKAQALAEKALTWMAENEECPNEFYSGNLIPSFCDENDSEFDCGTTECSRDCWKRFLKNYEAE
jgi:Tfp pilus assembly protein PilV